MENIIDLNTEIERPLYLNDLEDLDDSPSGERWPPLGAAAVDEELSSSSEPSFLLQLETERLKDLEDQQEKLNSSLIALTTHFAQVQFRLKQIVDAPAEDKQNLLRDLEEFAFRGIPDIPDISSSDHIHKSTKDVEIAISKQKDKQKKLIEQLKEQLEELEHYAYEMGEAGLPQSVLVEKQKVIIDELKEKLNLKVEDMDRLTIDDLRFQVDSAIDQLVNPLKMKEQLVLQLKTQVMDLERFINFLQGDASENTCLEDLKPRSKDCTCPVHTSHHAKTSKNNKNKSVPQFHSTSDNHQEALKKTLNMVRRVATLLQLFTMSQFSCGVGSKRMNSLKRSMKVNHWGDLRARLELAVVNVLALVSEHDRDVSYDDYSSDNDSGGATWSAKVARAVRKQLAVSIRDLMHHGLVSVEASTSIVPFLGCFPSRDRDVQTMHAWELILQYYDLKNGPRFNSTPVRRLSDSFNLNMVGNTPISHKHAMLSTIGQILSVHTQFKRSYDAQFKAFVCAALNCKKLVTWLRSIFRTQHLIDTYYEPWSYVAKTGYEDSLQSLDKLTRIDFYLPVDTAVHHFQNIRDAF